MADSVDRVFVHALNTVKRIPRTGSARPPEADRLRLYGLYKQSMEGDVEGVMPKPNNGATGSDEITELDKWEAWHSNGGLSPTEAKRQYISTLIETMHHYATSTSEARELVAELEFVWDQVRSNPVSSSGSSPAHHAGSRRMEQRQMSGFEMSRSRGDNGDKLRVLGPTSEEDEEDSMGALGQLESFRRGDPIEPNTAGLFSSELEERDQKWKRRVEQALVKMTTELAALREQMEANNFGAPTRRRKLWTWTVWLASASMRHLMVDAVLLALLLTWTRRRNGPRVQQGLRLAIVWIQQRISTFQKTIRFKRSTNG